MLISARYNAGMENNPYESPGSIKATEPRRRGRPRLDGPEMFRLLIAAVALYFILWAVCYAVHAVLIVVFAEARPAGIRPSLDPWAYGREAISSLAAGMVAFFFSKLLMRLAYRSDEMDEDSELP